MATANARLRAARYGNYLQQEHILKAVFEGLQLSIDAGLAIELRYFFETVCAPQSTAMMRTLFHSRQALSKSSDSTHTPFKPAKAAVIGAGMMGAGIAHAQAVAGIETILIDMDQAAADRGKSHGTALLEKAVAQGRMSHEKAEAAAARIIPTTDYSNLDGAELIIEAVFEDPLFKHPVLTKAEAASGSKIIASNTSTLPIDGLADAVKAPDQFLGIHFFSPVDRMPLVEIVRGRRTSDLTVKRAAEYVRSIGKIPIVVNDSRGFYTSRVFATYLAEGFEMLVEGIAPHIIDQIGRMLSMPRGPLELSDDVGLDLIDRIAKQSAADLGTDYIPRGQDPIVDQMVNVHGRTGRKNGKGIFDYPEKGRKTLWSGLEALAPVCIVNSTPQIIAEWKDRLLYRQIIESARCFEEGVISDPRQADVGAILAWGFPSWTGGPLSYIDAIGAPAFVERSQQLASRYGRRFDPPTLLVGMAQNGDSYYPV